MDGNLADELGLLAVSFFAAVAPKLLAFLAAIMLIAALFGEKPITDLVQQRANEVGSYRDIPDRQVVVLLVDDKTLLASGMQELERSTIACLTHQIAQAGPRVIGLDYVFKTVPASQNTEDCRYANDTTIFPLDRIAGIPIVTGSMISLTSGRLSEATSPPKVSSPRLMNWGHTQLNESMATPTVREISHIVRTGPDDYPIVSFSMLLAVFASGTDNGRRRFQHGRHLRGQLRRCENTPSGCTEMFGSDFMPSHALRFHDPYKALRIESAYTLLHGPCDEPSAFQAICAPMFEDKIVIVGDANRFSVDRFLSPLTTNFPIVGQLRYLSRSVQPISGVIFHAMATQNLLSGQPLRQQPFMHTAWVSLSLFAVLPLLALTIWILRGSWIGSPSRAIWLGYASSLLAAVLLSSAVVLYAVRMMAEHGREVPLSFHLPAIIFGLALALTVTRALSKLDSAAQGKYMARHLLVGKCSATDSSLASLLEKSLPALSFVIRSDIPEQGASVPEMMSQIQETLKKWANIQLRASQSREYLYAFLDNWAFNRTAMHFFVPPDNLSPRREAACQELFDALSEQFKSDFGSTTTGSDRSRNSDIPLNRSRLVAGAEDIPLVVTIGSGSITISDLSGPAEKDVLTVSGRLMDSIVAEADEQDIDTIRVLRAS